MRKKMKVFGMAVLCAILLAGCTGSDPSDSVMELVKNGNVEQAQQIYAEKISGKEEYESSFVEKFIPYLKNLIESYNNGELSEEKIDDEFEMYKEMLGENVTFKDAEERLSDLEISKHCFETAEKLRLEGELTQAYRMYARVIKKDRCYETAQQYITQIPADYLSESEELFESGQYQEAVRQSILGYALLDDKSGFDEIAIKVTKQLAEDYGFDNVAVLVEADSFYNTHYDVSVKCDSYKGQSLESMSRNDIVKLHKGFHDIFFNAVTNAWKGTGGSCLFLLEDIYSEGKWYNVDINSDEVEIRSESERSNYRQEMKEWSDKRYSSSENKSDNDSTNNRMNSTRSDVIANGNGKDRYGHDKFDAFVVAENAVKEKLKSPSTAQFCTTTEATIGRNGNTWTVKGWVDAQNGYGAMVRANFVVTFTFASKNTYSVALCTVS